MEDKYLKNCNFVKTILMLIIVVYHSLLFWGGEWFTGNPSTVIVEIKYFTQWLNSFHIYAFVFVAGFIFYHLKHNLGKYSDSKKFILNKSKRLLVPYAFCLVIWVIPIQYLFFKFNLETLIKQYLLGTSPNQLWFLLMLFWVYIIFYFLSNFFKERNILGSIVAIGFYGVGIVGGKFLPNVFSIWTGFKYVPIFYFGFKLKQFDKCFLYKIPVWIWFVVDVVLFMSKMFLPATNGTLYTLCGMGLDFALSIVGSVMAFFALQKLALLIREENSVINALFKHSFGVYLFHQQIIYFVIYPLNEVISPLFIIILSIIISGATSFLITHLLLKTKPTRFLIGEK